MPEPGDSDALVITELIIQLFGNRCLLQLTHVPKSGTATFPFFGWLEVVRQGFEDLFRIVQIRTSQAYFHPWGDVAIRFIGQSLLSLLQGLHQLLIK